MRERINDKGRLQHILSSINIILDNKDRFKLDEIESDPIVFFGFVKQLEIIGEAVYMLSKEFRNQHKDVEWDAIRSCARLLPDQAISALEHYPTRYSSTKTSN